MIFMFFGHPGSRFSIRGLSKARDFYVFQTSRVPIQYSRFEQSSLFSCFSGIQGPDKAFPFKWNTRVFNVFRRPGSRRSLREEGKTCLILSEKGSRVEGLRFVVVRIWIKSKKYKMKPSKNPYKTSQKQWFSDVKT